MKIQIPSSGFFILKSTALDLQEVKFRFDEKGATTKLFEKDSVLLASLNQFEDQGMWTDGENGVTYDMDLTNLEKLYREANLNHSDTTDKGQLLWILYNKYGIDFVDKLRGTFAFAIWDSTSREIFVITDPYGIKPVVYSDSSRHFCAASRIRHIHLADPTLKEINPDAIFHYLFFQAVCSPLTIYKKILKLEPGRGLCITNQLTSFTHYDIQYSPDQTLSEEDWKQQIKEQVKKAVNVCVPFSPYVNSGCFLSGGTDASDLR
jgi:asparagine synthase (glutamine-hydrolysing)